MTYSKTSRDIRVTVIPEFVQSESRVDQGRYVFAYHVTIENLGSETVRLINRHWVVVSSGRQIADVKGEGVVGDQPVLEQGGEYRYSSWTIIADPSGSMHGEYTFLSESGHFFDVEIPQFDLVHEASLVVH